ncbi:MAG: hypothetical protein QXT39_05185 [Conexivisphaerales archaeon]
MDATGCDVGVYIGLGTTGMIINAKVHDANQVGIFNDGGNAVIEGSTVYNGPGQKTTLFILWMNALAALGCTSESSQLKHHLQSPRSMAATRAD